MNLNNMHASILRYLEYRYPDSADARNSPHKDDPKWELYVNDLKRLGLVDFEAGIVSIKITTEGIRLLQELDSEEPFRKITHYSIGSLPNVTSSQTDQNLVYFSLIYQEPSDSQPVHQARFAASPEDCISFAKKLRQTAEELL